MLPIPRLKGQPQLWHMSGEPPGWVWMIPATSGLCRIGAAPAPFLLSSHPPPPPLLQAVSSWQLSCEPFLPLMRVPSAEPAIQPYPLMNIQVRLYPLPLDPLGPSASMDLVPVFPCMYHSVLPPHVGKGWVEKRLPDHKVYLNNALALDSAWISPEETGMLQRLEKPLLMTNQMAMSISRPAAASRNLPTVLVSPQRISACPVAIKRVGSNKRIALAAAAMMAMESETAQGPLGASAQPFHLLSFYWDFIKTPLTFCIVTFFLCPFFSLAHRCVVWTGDDRVFFFNPTMQLSVWEKPLDLKGRGDLNRIIEDPPHKRKKAEEGLNSLSADEDDAEGHNGKTKRNKMEDSLSSDQEKNKNEEKCTKTARHLTILPLELRIAHFRDMLLERGVSAFSTWEKELHKIVFDPRYLLLSSDERKQIFDQFVKARIKEEYKEKKSKLQQAKEEFRKLLEESKITSRSTFKEFSEKHGRDQRFKLVQKRKDQEHFFNQFVNALKKRDKENRLRLRKMR
uniref:Transcription elongation regulator 1-like protein n=1 Tax=Scleropages formosus TaxID=113540 RepID=A0A8C9RD15_SCLFO